MKKDQRGQTNKKHKRLSHTHTIIIYIFSGKKNSQHWKILYRKPYFKNKKEMGSYKNPTKWISKMQIAAPSVNIYICSFFLS